VIETTICTFYINNLFDDWGNKFDLDEATARKTKNLKLLFIELVKLILIKQ
tara:strand:+ start:359 stop:511 length:153 start_codon:yes stop_codon:yes gene_type:complete